MDNIVPEVLDKAPPSILKVVYSDGEELNLGKVIKPATMNKGQPQVTWNAKPGKLYLLSMIDVDVPSDIFCVSHWLLGNIKGTDLKNGTILKEYMGSGAPKDSGLHRYVFILFEQPGELKFDEPYAKRTEVKPRLCFSMKDFVKKYNLGDAIAVNYLNAQWDESVEELWKTFEDYSK